MMCARSNPRMRFARSRISAAFGSASASAPPMPTAWEPCPGKMSANDMVDRPLVTVPRELRQVHRPPGALPGPGGDVLCAVLHHASAHGNPPHASPLLDALRV